MAKNYDDNPLDSMRQAVARARSKGDGNIGKTNAPEAPVADPADDDVLAELGIPEGITTPIKRRARSKARTKKKATSTSARTSSKEQSSRSNAKTAATGDTQALRGHGGGAAVASDGAGDDEPRDPVTAQKPATTTRSRRGRSRRKAATPTTAKVVFNKTQRIIPEREYLVRNRVIADSANDHRVEAYRQLRSQTLRLLRKHDLKNFAITSAHEGAGKTLTAVNLAISMSMERNQTVLLVDLDLRKPSVHTTLGLETKFGIIDHLRSGVDVEDILVDPGFERLLILPGRAVAGNLSELLTAPEMSSLVGEITNRYDDRIVIFDLPPLLRNDDAMSFLPQVDACMYVIEEDVTTTSHVRQSMGLLADTLLLGTVLNKAA
ncbi:MAG: CpsD/CapB family tyrosine-protein kinase [Pseudomonadota bacterium]